MNDLKLATRHTPIDAIDLNHVLASLTSDCTHLAQAEGEIRDAVSAYRRHYARLQDILDLIEKRAGRA
jgi:hypothetical protein